MESILLLPITIGLIYLIIENNRLKSLTNNLDGIIRVLNKRVIELELRVHATMKGSQQASKTEVKQDIGQETGEEIGQEIGEEVELDRGKDVGVEVRPDNRQDVLFVESNYFTNKSLESEEPIGDFTERTNDDEGKINHPTFYSKLERQFLENWTGILGAIIMVVGVGFLGIYAALKISALGKFLLISGFAGCLCGGFFYLRQKESWLKLALWLRSSAGAIFLFSCLGSAGIEGLKWINDPSFGLGLLLIGILVNLYLGVIGGKQIFASLHVTLSLVALTMAPSNTIVLGLAGVVTLVGVFLTYREKWDYHLLVTISGFFGFHLYWAIQQNPISEFSRIIGIITVVIVSITVALVHYRKVYATKTFSALPFSVHLINWLYFGYGLFIHSNGNKITTAFLAIGSAAGFILAKKAKKLNIAWLYETDTIMAEICALIGLISLNNWQLNPFAIASGIFIETLIFQWMMEKQNERTLTIVGSIVAIISGLLTGLTGLKYYGEVSGPILMSTILFICISIIGTFFIIYTSENETDKRQKNYLDWMGILMAGFIGLIYIYTYKYNWPIIPILAFLGYILYLRNKRQSSSFYWASYLGLVGLHIIYWYHLLDVNPENLLLCILNGTGFFVVATLSAFWGKSKDANKTYSYVGIYLFLIQFLLISYLGTIDHSVFLPGLIWILGSVMALEFSKLVLKKSQTEQLFKLTQTHLYLLQTGVILISAYMVRHWAFHVQNENCFWGMKIRILTEILTLLVLIYWIVSTQKWVKKPLKIYGLLELLPELSIGFVALTLLREIDSVLQPLTWIGLSFGLHLIGTYVKSNLSQLKVYALILFWISCLQVAFISFTTLTPIHFFEHRDWMSGFAALLFQLLFLIYYHKSESTVDAQFPRFIGKGSGLVKIIGVKKNQLLIYPYMTASGMFLYWTFDKSMLTFLWVALCFVIFALSILLKEKQFRYVSLVALGLCLVRLIFFDLAQAETLTRAMVFLGVGILMLGMNSLYNRFKNRIQ